MNLLKITSIHFLGFYLAMSLSEDLTVEEIVVVVLKSRKLLSRMIWVGGVGFRGGKKVRIPRSFSTKAKLI